MILKVFFSLVSFSTITIATETILTPTHLQMELKQILQGITFNPPPDEIILQEKIVVLGGEDLEVHFYNQNHLREIVEKNPYFEAKNLYFVHNETVQPGSEFIAPGGEIAKLRFLQIYASRPLHIEGKLDTFYPIHLRHNSPFFDITGHIINGEIEIVKNFDSVSQTQALFLAKALDPLDPNSLKKRNNEAKKLLNERQVDRHFHPENYPSFEEMAPFCFLSCDGKYSWQEQDYLVNEGVSPLIYLAATKKELSQLRQTFLTPPLSLPILYLTRSAQKSGLYSLTPLTLKRGLILISNHNLGFSGMIDLNDIILSIKIKNHILFFSLFSFSTYQTSIVASQMIIGEGNKLLTHPPEEITPQMWENLKKYFQPD